MPDPDAAAILAGLARRKLVERRRWLDPAAQSDDPAVFAALACMYGTRNEIRDDVLAALKTRNARDGGVFAATLGNLFRAEHARLLADGSPRHAPYVLEGLWYAVRFPRGFAPFAAWARDLARSEPPVIPSALAPELAAVADLALAATGDDAALGRAVEAWVAGHLAEHADLIDLCIARRSPLLWDPLCAALGAVPERDDWLALAAGLIDYAAALDRAPDAKLVARYRARAAEPFAEPSPAPDGGSHG